MPTIDTLRKNLERKNNELASLKREQAKIQKESADAMMKASKAEIAAGKTKSSASYNSKMREADRYNKKHFDAQGKLASCEDKIAKKQKEINETYAKLAKEEKRQNEINQRNEKKRLEKQKEAFNSMTTVIADYENRQNIIEDEMEKLKSLPKKITVLLLATNPKDIDNLRLDEEARNIREMISKAKHRDSVNLETRWAVRPMDLLQYVNEINPTIIHFAGHGSKNGDLALEDNRGNAKLISPAAILQSIMTAGEDTVRLAYFDACYSDLQAKKVVEIIDAAIGMGDAITDQAAISFASQFYSAISFGMSVQKAFNQAKAILMMEYPEEADIPCLFVNSDCDAESLIIVNPDEIES